MKEQGNNKIKEQEEQYGENSHHHILMELRFVVSHHSDLRNQWADLDLELSGITHGLKG